ncbi:hypothetical protein N9W69_02345 [Flavobacteriaceae bacterium]|nr:hypothetical protein [Flavobacteriaceae bacterium]
MDELDYLPFSLLAVSCFAFGFLSVKEKIDMRQWYIPSALASKLGIVLLTVGLGSEVLILIAPEILASTIYFFTLFKTIGVYSLIFSDSNRDKIIVGIFMFQFALRAILGGLLIEFLIFGLFFAMFYSIKYPIKTVTKIVFISSASIFLIVYQGVKGEYRNLVWEGEVNNTERVAILTNLISLENIKEASSFDFENNEYLIQTIHRLNQGWHVSMVLNRVPSVVPFQHGQEFVNDIFSAFLPRIIWSNKRIVNDYQRFNYYTGHSLQKNTAMSLGVIGDFYINFGKVGTYFMMFIFGFLMARLIRWLFIKIIYPNPINLIWLPFIFSYLVRPGNEFYMVVNHLFKALIVVWIVIKIVYPKLNLMKFYFVDQEKNLNKFIS